MIILLIPVCRYQVLYPMPYILISFMQLVDICASITTFWSGTLNPSTVDRISYND